jgi:hypothetical protein
LGRAEPAAGAGFLAFTSPGGGMSERKELYYLSGQEEAWEEKRSRPAGFFKKDGIKATLKLADGSIINGKINLYTELINDHSSFDKFSEDLGTFSQRFSDLFTKGKNPFIVVFDATVGEETGKVLVVNKNKILWVFLED